MAQGAPLNDQFNTGTTPDSSIWTTLGNCAVGSGFLTITGAGGQANVVSKTPYLYEMGATFETYGNLVRTVQSGHMIGLYFYNGTIQRMLTFYNSWNWNANIHIYTVGDDNVTVDTDTGIACSGTGTKHTFNIKWLTTGYAEFRIDGTLIYTTTHIQTLTGGVVMQAQLGNVYDSGAQMQFDYCTVTVPSSFPPRTMGNRVAVQRASNF